MQGKTVGIARDRHRNDLNVVEVRQRLVNGLRSWLSDASLGRSKPAVGKAWREADIGAADAGGEELFPGSFRVVGEPQQAHIRWRDHPGVEQHVEINDLRPIVAVDAHNGDGSTLARLHEREHLEQLGERAESSGKGERGRRADCQMSWRMAKEWN